MMRLASRGICKRLLVTQFLVECLALLLCACVLPIRTVWMAKRTLSVFGRQLVYQRLARIQSSQQRFCVVTPKDSPVLHACSRDTLDRGEVDSIIFQSLKNKVEGLEPQSSRGVDFALGGIRQDAILYTILLSKVGVEINFGLVDEFEAGSNDDGCC